MGPAMMSRGDLADGEWAVLEPLLPVGNNRCCRWRAAGNHRFSRVPIALPPQAAGLENCRLPAYERMQCSPPYRRGKRSRAPALHGVSLPQARGETAIPSFCSGARSS
jgi:hypothetical protein